MTNRHGSLKGNICIKLTIQFRHSKPKSAIDSNERLSGHDIRLWEGNCAGAAKDSERMEYETYVMFTSIS